MNHITHTSFEVSWSKVTFTEYVRGYDLTVMSEGKVVYRERFPLSSTAAYNKKISCLEPGKQYVVKIDALYSFVSDRQEFLKISNSIPVTTPLGKASQECVGGLHFDSVYSLITWCCFNMYASKIQYDSTRTVGTRILE